jgi:signal transduction histidine kinase
MVRTETWSPWTLVVAAGALVVLLVTFGVRLGVPSEAAIVPVEDWRWTSDGPIVVSVAPSDDPATNALRTGDLVTAIGGRSMLDWADHALDPGIDRPAWTAGELVPFSVIRDSRPQEVLVRVGSFPVGPSLLAGWPLILFVVSQLLVTGYIALRRPGQTVARALVIGSVANLASVLPWQLGFVPSDLVRGGPFLVAFAGTVPLNLLFWASALRITLAFPGSTPPTVRHSTLRWIVWGGPILAAAAGIAIERLLIGNTLNWIGTWANVTATVISAVLILALIRTAMAYDRTPVEERRPVRWVGAAFAFGAIAILVLTAIPIALTGRAIAGAPPVAIFALPVPIALAIAIVRDRLFAIDVLRRTRGELVVAREEERRRLRRDLHDGLGPSLAAMTMKLGVAKGRIRDDPTSAEALIDQVTLETQAAIAEIRRMASELRPPALDEVGLVEAIRRRAIAFETDDPAAGMIRFEVRGPADRESPPGELPAAVEVAVYRIAVEAMTNVVRHAGARACTVTIGTARGVRLTVEDDGSGLPIAWRPGIGTTSMRERAIELGGTCRIETRPEGGTRVDAWLPFPPG